MHIIKLNAINSTNDHLKQLVGQRTVEDLTAVVCDHQTQGKGQKGNTWVSEKSKNLTMSILKIFQGVEIARSFEINCAVSLAIFDVLNELTIPQVKVKWPNDIMSGNQKLGGILIENTLQGKFVKRSIIGIGLNVNQTNFEDLKRATSLKLKMGCDYDLEDFLEAILKKLIWYLPRLESGSTDSLKSTYESVLFRKGIVSKFSRPDESTFLGRIQNVNHMGQLVIEIDSGEKETFGFKEIQMIY